MSLKSPPRPWSLTANGDDMVGTYWTFIALIACTAYGCGKARSSLPDAGSQHVPPSVSWIHAYDATLYSRTLDVSCAPTDAKQGVDGCIALVRYQGQIGGLDVA